MYARIRKFDRKYCRKVTEGYNKCINPISNINSKRPNKKRMTKLVNYKGNGSVPPIVVEQSKQPT